MLNNLGINQKKRYDIIRVILITDEYFKHRRCLCPVEWVQKTKEKINI